MTQLEIATRIFCSGKGYTIDESWILAGNLISLDKEINHNPEDDSYIMKTQTCMSNIFPKPHEKEIDQEELAFRTANRTQQIIDLGFEWNEDRFFFVKDLALISMPNIEEKDDDEWNELIAKQDPTITLEEAVQVIDEAFPTESNEVPTIDFFRGKDYIEFEMDKSICRLYKESNKLIAEEDLQVTKKTESKFILANSDNEEYQLGITIYKK